MLEEDEDTLFHSEMEALNSALCAPDSAVHCSDFTHKKQLKMYLVIYEQY